MVASKGPRAVRLGGIVMTDTLATALAGVVLAGMTGARPLPTVMGLFGVGVFVHWVFDVPTGLNALLGLSGRPAV